MRVIINLCIIAVIGCISYFVGTRLFGRPGGVKNNGQIAGVSIIAGFLALWAIASFGVESPGSPFEKSEYQSEFFVKLFPEDSPSKKYRVPGMITAKFEDSTRVYILDHVRFSDGGIRRFSSHESLKPGRKVLLKDDSGNEWHVELTSDSVPQKSHPNPDSTLKDLGISTPTQPPNWPKLDPLVTPASPGAR